MVPLFVAAQLASATTLHVGPGQQYANITRAVNAAALNDTIVIHAGVYDDQISSYGPLTFVGDGDPVWRNPGNASPLIYARDGLSITGIIFEGGGRWPCISVQPSGFGPLTDVTIDQTTFHRCNSAVYAYETDLLLTDSVFVDNRSGVYQDLGQATLTGNVFARNGSSGAMYVRQMLDNRFIDNDGGFQAFVGGGELISGNTFCNNRAGLYIEQEGNGGGRPSVRVVDNVFIDNQTTALASAGGVTIENNYAGPLQMILANNTFAGNGGSMAAHVLAIDAEVVLVNDIFARGAAAAGLSVFGSGTMVGDWNLFYANDAGDLNGLAAASLGANTLWGVDPMVTSYSRDFDCSNDDHTPLPGS
ncbi:MAG: hypothetical protein KC621_20595, partial [Myxococcales bacterium]|nr:hypothetical protein [Myxococcales bacterium]